VAMIFADEHSIRALQFNFVGRSVS